MEKELLKVIKKELLSLGINYEYGEYQGEHKYPYAVGEYSEGNYDYESNITDGEFILVVFHKGNELDLINIKEQIKEKFADYRSIVNGGTIYVSYRNKLFIREADLKKMEIYLETKTMKGE